MRFAYEVRRDESDAIWIEDLSNSVGCMSVTNAAEEVIQDLIANGLLSPGKRVYYTDTDGNIDELCHNGVAFTGFAPGI